MEHSQERVIGLAEIRLKKPGDIQLKLKEATKLPGAISSSEADSFSKQWATIAG
jgi:hypothetical protein